MRGLHSLSGVANERNCAEDWIHFSSDQKQALSSSGDQLARAHEMVLPMFIYMGRNEMRRSCMAVNPSGLGPSLCTGKN